MTRRIALALAALLVLAPPAAAKKPKIVPKGTPYAAEVKLTVTGTVSVERHETLEQFHQCQSGADAKWKKDVTIGGSWTAKYNQVTVPTRNEHDLGRAFKRLHVPVTATSPGTSGILGQFAIGGYGPLTQSDGGDSDCAQQDYFTQGTLGTDSPIQALFLDQQHKFHGLTLPFATFVLGAPGPAAPSTWTDSLGGQNSTDREIGNLITDVPDQELELENNGHNDIVDFGGFQSDFDIEILRHLEDQKVVQIPDLVRTGEKDCGSDTDEIHTQSCTLKWSFKFTPKLTRHFLYKTKRDYPR